MAKKLRIGQMILVMAGLLIALPSGGAWAHGGVSMEDDLCILKIGPYTMHFTGYQPEKAQSEEFCEDIPYEGKAIVVLDHVDKILRDMPTDFRVVRDVKNLGVTAQYEQLGTPEEIKEATIYYEDPKLYPRGTKQFELDFGKGSFIGIVKIQDERMGKEHVSVFPFSVGYGNFNTAVRWGLFGIVALLLMGGIYYFAVRKPLPTQSQRP